MPKYYTDQPLPRDRFIPWYFVIAFTLLALLEAVLVTTAIRTSPGVVTDRPYERGLAYNRFLEQQAEQDARGWQHSLHLDNRQLRLTLNTREGMPLEGAHVAVTATRPVGAAGEFYAVLPETGPGRYEAQLDFPQPGQWKIGVTAAWQDLPYRTQQVVFVRP